MRSAQKCREDRSSGSRDMLADRQTHTQTDRQNDRNTPLPYRGGVKTDKPPNYRALFSLERNGVEWKKEGKNLPKF